MKLLTSFITIAISAGLAYFIASHVPTNCWHTAEPQHI